MALYSAEIVAAKASGDEMARLESGLVVLFS
jgi:hypothetical protein